MFKTGINNVHIYRILLILTAGFFALLAYSFRQPVFVCLIFMMLLITAFSYIALNSTSRSVKMQLPPPCESVECEQVYQAIVTLSNSSFPITECHINCKIQNLYYQEPTDSDFVTALPGRKDTKLMIPIALSKAGMLRITFNKMILYDYLHIFQKELPLNRTVSVPVLPIGQKLALPPVLYGGEGDEEIISDRQKASSSPDIIDIREYRPGDALHLINWKLSAKTDLLLVKQTSVQQSVNLTVLIDLSRDMLQDTISCYFTLYQELLEQGEIFYVAFANPDSSFERLLVTDSDSGMDAMIQLYYAAPDPVHSSVLTKYRAQFPSDLSILLVNGNQIQIIQID